MADDTSPDRPTDDRPTETADDSTATTKRTRRMLRPAAEPTTLRQQSEQAQAKADKPRRASKTGRILGAPFRFIGRLLARIFRPLGRFRFFRAIGYILFPPYFRNSWRELRQVTWPNGRQTRQLTFAVIIFSLVFGLIAAVVDFGLDKLFRELILNK